MNRFLRRLTCFGKFLFWTVVITFVLFVTTTLTLGVANASPMDGFEMGKVQVAGVTVCRDEATAKSVLVAEAKDGYDAGNATFIKAQEANVCANVPGLTFKPTRIVFASKTERGVGRVVEIVNPDDHTQKLYWLTFAKPRGYKEV